MTTEPQWHEIFVDEEVHHFLHKTAKATNTSENEVLRSIIFGEKMGMSAEAREQLARIEEAPYERRLTDPDVLDVPEALGGDPRRTIKED